MTDDLQDNLTEDETYTVPRKAVQLAVAVYVSLACLLLAGIALVAWAVMP